MCLGSDKICMGYGAELGPIDPQIQIDTNMWIPARAWFSHSTSDPIQNLI
jgi:hypothetical protein